MMAVKYSCWRVRTHTPFFWQTTFWSRMAKTTQLNCMTMNNTATKELLMMSRVKMSEDERLAEGAFVLSHHKHAQYSAQSRNKNIRSWSPSTESPCQDKCKYARTERKMVNDRPSENMKSGGKNWGRRTPMCCSTVTVTEPRSKDDHDDRDDRLCRTLSGEQDLLGIAGQPKPRWSLSVGKHLYPVHELLAPVTKQNHV